MTDHHKDKAKALLDDITKDIIADFEVRAMETLLYAQGSCTTKITGAPGEMPNFEVVKDSIRKLAKQKDG